MPQRVELDVRGNGLIVDASVWMSPPRRAALFRLGQSHLIGPAVPISLIIDTGADSTMLSTQLMRTLGIAPTSQTRVLTSGSRGVPEPCDVYDVELQIMGNATQKPWRISSIGVLARSLENQGTDGMLGRDVLKLGILHYDGPRGRFTLDYA